jgi:response regulator RpfG family c-di-GMP phosphodiesterase
VFQQFFGVEIVSVDSWHEAQSAVCEQECHLILVNRVLDVNGASGVEIIKQLKSSPDTDRIPVMLVSNYDDAQLQAEQLGAARGFGKAALGQPAMLARVRSILD